MSQPNRTDLATTNTVPVAVGSASTQLMGNTPSGTVITNIDLANSIWVSENPSVSPGFGWELGPGGYLTWQYDRAPCYACVDTGVTAPVLVTLGNAVSDLVNPLFIAEALALHGIPSAYLTTLLFNGLQSIIGGPNQVKADIPIGQYASLLIFMFAYPAGTAGSVIARITQALNTGLLYAIDSFYATAELTNNNGFLALSIPVLGNYLTIENDSPTWVLQAVVFGTNRPTASATSKRFLGYAQLISGRTYSISNGAAVAGTVYGGAIVDYPAGAQIPNQLSLNGLYSVSGSSSLSGTLYCWTLDPDNTLRGLAVVNVATNVPFNAVAYFQGYARFVFVPSINGNLNCPFTVTPGAGP